MGALTRVVDGLERYGLLRRECSSRDRRAVKIGVSSCVKQSCEPTREG